MKGMKKLLKKIYKTGQMMWEEVVDLNDELELGYKSSEVGMEEESDEELELESEVGEEEWIEVEEERKALRREVNRWEAKQAAEQAEKQAVEVEAEVAKEPSGSKYGDEDEEEGGWRRWRRVDSCFFSFFLVYIKNCFFLKKMQQIVRKS